MRELYENFTQHSRHFGSKKNEASNIKTKLLFVVQQPQKCDISTDFILVVSNLEGVLSNVKFDWLF